MAELNQVGKPLPKKDSMALVTGKGVYMDDVCPRNALIVKLLRSPHANAIVSEIDTSRAKLVPGVVCVLTWEDVPHLRYTQAGQSFPEPSPYDRYILDRHVRYIGDEVAIVAAETEDAADKALKLIKVKYDVLDPVLDYHTALDHPILVHPEEDWKCLSNMGADNKRNLVSTEDCGEGDVDAVLASCDAVVDEVYHTIANDQAMMETFRTATWLDENGRLVVLSSTQIVFHVRRILSNALGIPKSKIRVIKPRIGGGFGAKQTAIAEPFPAIVTLKTGRPAKCIYTREESHLCGCPRHEMEMHVRIGGNKDGKIRAIDLYTISNTGAYAEHGPTTVGLSGHKSISIYRGLEAFRFRSHVVYTNVQPAGAFRGYGATQGIFAVESAVDELSKKLNLDPAYVREQNLVKQGDVMPSYYGETATSCTLDECYARAKELSAYTRENARVVLPNGHIRAKGSAIAMQGSAISGLDVAGASLKCNDDGFISMRIAAADMGTGCDTSLAQIVAECLECDTDQIIACQVDTDVSPYDSGSYASSTAFLTGGACLKAAQALRDKITETGAKMLGCSLEDAVYENLGVTQFSTGKRLELSEIVSATQNSENQILEASASNSCQNSPPPFMAAFCEIDIDPETGKVTPIEYNAVVDCGTCLNPNLTTVQTEGGLVQGIGMALYENITYSPDGKIRENNFMNYKIPTRMDTGKINVEFIPSYEPQGPYGAKSIGEIVIDTPCPAIANALATGCGVRIRTMPITPEKVWRALQEKKD